MHIFLSPFDLFVICSYLACLLFVGLWAGRGVRDLEEYAVAGRGYSGLVIFATLSASFIGGGFTMGNAEKVFLVGIANIAALWGFSLKEVLVAVCVAPRVKAFPRAISVGDVMRENFGVFGQVVTGVFSVLLCAGILGAQVGAIGYIFNLFLGIDPLWGILIGTGIVVTYDTIGGMRAVVATDVMQFAILAVGIPLTLILAVGDVGGWDALTRAVPQSRLELFGSVTPLGLASLFLTFLLGETLVPPYTRRLLISKNARSVRNGVLASGLFSVPFFAVSGLIGLAAYALNPGLDPNLALPSVIAASLPMGLKGLLIAGILAVLMSSADSFLNSASVAFVQDIVNPLRKNGASGLGLARLSTFVTGVLAVVFAVSISSVLDILIYAYNFWSPVILPPLAATLMGVKARPRDLASAMAGGLAGVLVWNVLLGRPGGVDGLVVGVFTNAALFFASRALSRRRAA